MAHEMRLLETGVHDAYFNMGLDEAILESVSRGRELPTLRLYGWNPKAISLGYFQGARQELDLDACARLGVNVVRRITGGGAVLHDKEVTYSLSLPETHPLARSSIIESYEIICSALVRGMGFLGIDTEFTPINDILWRGKKVSGNAQTRKHGCILQHGTILLHVDVEEMFCLLLVPKEKATGKLIADVKQRVGSLSEALNREVGFEETVKALIRGFTEALDLKLIPGKPSEEELARARSLAKEKFSTEAWIFKR
jgi:lipoate-protein ligase A